MSKTITLFTAVTIFAFAGCAAKPSPDTAPPSLPPEPAPVEAVEAPEPEPEPAVTEPPPPPAPTKDIIETASEAGSFNTLLAAIDKAELTETLKGPGPFTVFAPTDEAFAKLPKGELDKLLKDKKKLAAVLTYHVVSGTAVKSTDVAATPKAATVGGGELTFDATEGVRINGAATVLSADIETTNGIIHVIDTVLMPPKAVKAK